MAAINRPLKIERNNNPKQRDAGGYHKHVADGAWAGGSCYHNQHHKHVANGAWAGGSCDRSTPKSRYITERTATTSLPTNAWAV